MAKDYFHGNADDLYREILPSARKKNLVLFHEEETQPDFIESVP